ncbi:MAG: S8 family serine peptidase [Pirellulaceae bacterium]
MQRPDDSVFTRRDWKFESFEERLALSADPIADFWIDYQQHDLEQYAGPIVPLAAEGHGWTDVAAARDQFGLRGGRQTVAVIDSGIAYDHLALGGGLGKAERVVGGWDFAENDANPYDDGPAGFHGTHVAGIIGANDSQYAGVASDVDLVALRVFDDRGNGYFTWVESALRWVHQNRNGFDNPITTVNLSLGTEWNTNTLPQWATLEDELKQLAGDGIFISVAAGNSFLVYNGAGLSYPAVSEYVTPVASVDANGNLSRFSQRADRVLAAPGERVMSTLPDHFFGGDGNKNDWGATSGTSMAAPYVAGASVLVREAMTNLGFSQITQETIYDRLRTSADLVYDAATNASYRRVNLQRALDSLVGADDFGNSMRSATSIGSLTSTTTVSGTIGRVSDQDFFRFTAGQTGTATLALQASEQLAAQWQTGGSGQVAGNMLTMNVVAGQIYIVGVVGGGTSIGKFAVGVQLVGMGSSGESNGDESGGGNTGGDNIGANPINLGVVEQLRRNRLNLTTAGNWFQLQASRSGTLTVEALFQLSRGNIDLEVYDVGQRLIVSSATWASGERVDFQAAAGDTYFVRVRGVNANVDLRLTNLVTFAGNSVTVTGTNGADTFQWHGDARQFAINGVTYETGGSTNIRFDGRGGYDTATLVGGAAAENAVLSTGHAQLVGGGIAVTASNVQFSRVVGQRNDSAVLHDSAGQDFLTASATSVVFTGNGFRSAVEGFGNVTVYATAGGDDYARLHGSAGNDVLGVSLGRRVLHTGGVNIWTENFQTVHFYGGEGWDHVNFFAGSKHSSLGGQGATGWAYAQGYITQFAEVESLLAHVRAKQRLHAELSALDYFYRRIGV